MSKPRLISPGDRVTMRFGTGGDQRVRGTLISRPAEYEGDQYGWAVLMDDGTVVECMQPVFVVRYGGE